MDDSEIERLDELESKHFWYKLRKIQLSRWLEANLEIGSSVLDLGSATGGNTLVMKNLGLNVTSFEYSKIGCSIQKQKNIPVIQGDARNAPFGDATFDGVICLDVLEHIIEDNLVVDEIARILKVGGRFLISVPEDPNLWSAHDVAVNHVRRYTKSSLISLFDLKTFHILEVRSSIIFLKPIVYLQRSVSRGSALTALNPFLNMILFLICYFEISLPLKRQRGTTLWLSGIKI